MPKLIFSDDKLMAAALADPDECQRVIEALEYVASRDGEQDVDDFANKLVTNDLTPNEWMAEVKEILRQFKTEISS